ncbi:PREDICTED: nesprin-1-like [Priapulus caudatus]|uniref:Nesprin-1-like n=1 Tax=Priapulus caudatus TaxID=37621 RepID=A0ABM1F5M2_PRICU|nr:PREDICTED: nesprin-1-like [Priapulus caudatus]
MRKMNWTLGEICRYRAAIEPKLSCLKELQKTMSEGNSRVKQAAKMCDTVTPHTSTDGAQTMYSNLEHLALSCGKLTTDVLKAILRLETQELEWKKVDVSISQLKTWVSDTQAKLDKMDNLEPDLISKQTHLDKCKAVAEDLQDHEVMFNQLVSMSLQLAKKWSDEGQLTAVSELDGQYRHLVNRTQALVETWEVYVVEHEQFGDSYSDTVDWLSLAKSQYQSCSDTTGSKEASAERRLSLQELINRRGIGEVKVVEATSLSVSTLEHTSCAGHAEILRNMADLQAAWDLLHGSLADCRALLDDCLVAWELYEVVRVEFSDWLIAIEEELQGYEDRPLPLGEAVARLADLVTEWKYKKVSRDQLREASDHLLETFNCDCTPRLEVALLNDRYLVLNEYLQVKFARLILRRTPYC